MINNHSCHLLGLTAELRAVEDFDVELASGWTVSGALSGAHSRDLFAPDLVPDLLLLRLRDLDLSPRDLDLVVLRLFVRLFDLRTFPP